SSRRRHTRSDRDWSSDVCSSDLYKVKPDHTAENERYIQRVFEQLEHERPSGLRYASFKLGDGVSFVHIVSLEAADGSNPLGELRSEERRVGKEGWTGVWTEH